MIKQFIALLFLFAFLTQIFSRAVIVCSFYANQNYIAKNLCENRTKPNSCCAGKCQLKKRLNKETNEDKQNHERKTGKETEVLYSVTSFSYEIIKYISLDLNSCFTIYSEKKPVDKSYPYFHPPSA